MSTLASFDLDPRRDLDAPAFPRLAAVVRVLRAARSGADHVRRGWAAAGFTAQTWRAPGSAVERARHASAICQRLLDLADLEVDRIGAIPELPALVVVRAEAAELVRAVVAATPGFTITAAPVVPSWLAARVGNHVVTDDEVAVHRHAITALRAGLPVITTAAVAERFDLIGLARLVRVAVYPTIARVRGPRAPQLRVVVSAPLHPVIGEITTAALAAGHGAMDPT